MGVYSFWNSDLIPSIDSLILATVSSSSGQTILQQMADQARLSGYASPQYLLSEGNTEWRFGASLQRASNAAFSGSNGNSMNGSSDDSEKEWGAYTFIWFRFVLFAFIFCFPFVRIFRLWWAAGGRIRFRRNEAGRITGLRYQRPMDNWFVIETAGRHRNDRDPSAAPIRGRLTKEQVMELPEICYEEIADDDDEIDAVNDEHTKPSEILDESSHDITVNMGNDDDAMGDSNKTDGEITSEDKIDDVASSETDNNEQSTKSSLNSSSKEPFTKTISTTCSICIDEFEGGETVRLLPRCGHGFHTECIMPWLTERQGCCPFCKTSVLEPEDVDSNDDNQADEVGENQDNQEEEEVDQQRQEQSEQQQQRRE